LKIGRAFWSGQIRAQGRGHSLAAEFVDGKAIWAGGLDHVDWAIALAIVPH
jgi:hypothetical protein